MTTPLTVSEHSPQTPSDVCYVGRFAPSPTGPLHFGSLVTALASYLDARSVGGTWLVRVEDLDPPREIPGATTAILRALETHGLHWDGSLLYQSQRLAAYQDCFEQLRAAHYVYPCRCTRKAIAALGGVYPGTCRNPSPPIDPSEPVAWRLKVDSGMSSPQPHIHFNDIFLGEQAQDLAASGDVIVKRKDGLFAYQLAVVVDDQYQGITHVIRGSDLLDSTGCQIVLFNLLKCTPPQFGHSPLVLNELGQKLSKQHHAPPLEDDKAASNLYRALVFLQQQPPAELQRQSVAEVLAWGIAHWRRERVKTE